MGNTLLTPSVIAREALVALENNLVMAGLVHRDFSNEFQKVGDTITVRKPATFEAKEFSSTIDIQDAVEQGVSVSLDKHLDVSFAVTAKDLTLKLQDFSEQFLNPAMQAIAQKIDGYLTGLYVDIPYNAAVGGTPAISDIAALDKIMNLNKAPQANRALVLDPTTKAKYIVLDAILHAEKSGSTEALRNASMGQVLSFAGFMDQNVASHTKGTLAASSGSLAIASAAAGDTTVTIAATACSGTLKKGDIITIADTAGSYVVTGNATAASNSIVVGIYPGLASSVTSKAVTIKDSHVANLAFHKNAFALVTRPLELPMGAVKAEVINYRGLSVRAVYGYDMTYKRDLISLDILCGVKTLTKELAVRFLG